MGLRKVHTKAEGEEGGCQEASELQTYGEYTLLYYNSFWRRNQHWAKYSVGDRLNYYIREELHLLSCMRTVEQPAFCLAKEFRINTIWSWV